MPIEIPTAESPSADAAAPARVAALPLRESVKAIGFIGDSGSGKTTLVAGLIRHFVAAGWRVAAVKHAHQGFDIDRPGKDSDQFREAGAAQVLVASDRRWVLMSDEPQTDAPGALARQLARLDPCDLVLVEGYRGQGGIPFIEVRRGPRDPLVPPRPVPQGRVAVATDGVLAPGTDDAGLPRLDLTDGAAVARFITTQLELRPC